MKTLILALLLPFMPTLVLASVSETQHLLLTREIVASENLKEDFQQAVEEMYMQMQIAGCRKGLLSATTNENLTRVRIQMECVEWKEKS